MNDEQKRIKALIDEQIQLLKDNPKLKGKTEEQLWGAELNSRRMKEQHADPDWKAIWDEKYKIGIENRNDDHVWRENQKLAMQKLAQDPEWLENIKLANQKKAQDPEWLENHKLAMQKLAQDPEWQENQKLAAQKRSQTPEWIARNTLNREKMYNDPIWQENHGLAMKKLAQDPVWKEKQQLGSQKAFNKSISCDGVIYNSQKEAALAIAPETRLTEHSKTRWLHAQIKKYPDRYFYVDENGNKPPEPTYMTLEERKALAKMKREQDDITK